MIAVYMATKAVFALMASVWCVRVVPSSHAQSTNNVHPLVLTVFLLNFFLLENRRPHAEPRVSENQKVRPKHIHRSKFASEAPGSKFAAMRQFLISKQF